MQDAYELAAKIFQFHCKTNILHSVFTLKSRIQDIDYTFLSADLIVGSKMEVGSLDWLKVSDHVALINYIQI